MRSPTLWGTIPLSQTPGRTHRPKVRTARWPRPSRRHCQVPRWWKVSVKSLRVADRQRSHLREHLEADETPSSWCVDRTCSQTGEPMGASPSQPRAPLSSPESPHQPLSHCLYPGCTQLHKLDIHGGQTSRNVGVGSRGVFIAGAKQEQAAHSQSPGSQMVFREEFLKSDLLGRAAGCVPFLWLVSSEVDRAMLRELDVVSLKSPPSTRVGT